METTIVFGYKDVDKPVILKSCKIVLEKTNPELDEAIDGLNGVILISENDPTFDIFNYLSKQGLMKFRQVENTNDVTNDLIETIILQQLDSELVLSTTIY